MDPITHKLCFRTRWGQLYSYGHFIVEVVIPFLEHYEGYLRDYPSITLFVFWVAQTPLQHMGGFTSFFEELFPRTRIVYTPPADFKADKQYTTVDIVGCGFGPYPVSALRFAERELGWGAGTGTARDLVLVIERGYRPIVVPDGCPPYHAVQTGSRKRCLHNQAAVNAVVGEWCGARDLPLRIVRPEELTLAEQQRLFAEACIVIGQHGAGLCNLVFAGRGQGHHKFHMFHMFHKFHILEISFWGLRTIERLAAAKEWAHHRVRSTQTECDLDHLAETLSAIRPLTTG